MVISGVARLGRDAELRITPNGAPVCNLALAFHYGQKQQDGYRLSQWVDCALWGKQAEVLAQYLKKGGQVSVTASDPHIEEFVRGDGSGGSKLVANIVNIELISSGNNQQQSSAAAPIRPPVAQKAAAQAAPIRPPVAQKAAAQAAQSNGGAEFYDDVPF